MINFTKKKTKKAKQEEIEEESSEEEVGAATMTLAELIQGKEVDTPESRSIMFVGEVTEEKAAELISAIIVLAQTKEDEENERADDIKIYVNTYGGSADEMFAI